MAHTAETRDRISASRKMKPVLEDAAPFKIEGTYCRLIPLTMGYFVIVQADQYEHLMQWKWHAQKARRTVYAARYERMPDGKRVHIDMHRQLKGFPPTNVDHRNGDGLHNFDFNLRTANDQDNCRNRRPHGERRFKGAYWDKSKGLYVAKICIDYRVKHLGQFGMDQIAAAKAYDAAAFEAFGPFAKLNFPIKEIA